ncbi:Hypothetical protein PBC10988_15740 [Planctomycetales bacterium 10988]|nr:Hypothetical protein PBC10988_15740 [Planctomycetales bacterium 10988]
MKVQQVKESRLTDQSLQRRVANYLNDRNPALKDLEVEVDGGVVTLRGRVQTRYDKEVGEACCRRVAGVLSLIDQVDVQAAEAAASKTRLSKAS